MSQLFAFEVPTSAGRFRIIGPDTLPADEAERIGAQIARLIPLLVLAPLPDADDVLAALEGTTEAQLLDEAEDQAEGKFI